MILSRHLESQGYQVDAVTTGLEAIEELSKADYNVIIMDVYLPQMNGYEAAMRIRELGSNKANTPIIALTSSTNERDKKICLEAGMNDYIIKSDENDDLFNCLEGYQQKLLAQSNKKIS